MHPTIAENLVKSHHDGLRAEAEHARLVSIARAHARGTTTAPSAGRPRARLSIVRRLVDRLATA